MGPQLGELNIAAQRSTVGEAFALGAGSSIAAIGGAAESVVIGDNVTIGAGVEIRARHVCIGDYVTIHRNTTIYGYESISIGECCWIGQNVVLNCTAPLSIGRACVISAYSNIWTHFSGGDVLQGCRYNEAAPATLGDDVWIGVQATVAPVNVAEKALILSGSVLTRDVPANEAWGGNPAANLTEKLGRPFVEVSLGDKFERMCEKLLAFSQGYKGYADSAQLAEQKEGWLRIGGLAVTMADYSDAGCTVFDVRNRTYTKERTAEEIAFMKSLLYTIKFFSAPTAGQQPV